MKVDEYKVLVMCLENGVQVGWNRAYKHSDTPEPHYIQSCIEEAVLHEIFEYFNFDNDGDSAINEISGLG